MKGKSFQGKGEKERIRKREKRTSNGWGKRRMRENGREGRAKREEQQCKYSRRQRLKQSAN